MTKKILLGGFCLAAVLFFLAAIIKPEYPRIVGAGKSPPWQFYYTCMNKGAKRVYKTHDDRWACRVKSGELLIYRNWAEDFWGRR